MKQQYVGYVRESTSKQGLHGLGMAAQRAAIAQFTSTNGNSLIGTFAEVKTGKRADRARCFTSQQMTMGF